MSEMTDHTRISALDEANRNLAGGVLATPSRRPWATPQVILGTLDQAQLNVGPTDDGDGGATPDNS